MADDNNDDILGATTQQRELSNQDKLGLALIALASPLVGQALGGRTGAYAGAAAGAKAVGDEIAPKKIGNKVSYEPKAILGADGKMKWVPYDGVNNRWDDKNARDVGSQYTAENYRKPAAPETAAPAPAAATMAPEPSPAESGVAPSPAPTPAAAVPTSRKPSALEGKMQPWEKEAVDALYGEMPTADDLSDKPRGGESPASAKSRVEAARAREKEVRGRISDVEKEVRGRINQSDRDRDRDSKNKGDMAKLPLDKKKIVETLATKQANKISIRNQMRGAYAGFKAAKTKDAQIRAGRQMLKILNSTEGADAISSEEGKRLGDALELQVFNWKGPGPLFGRDLEGFATQVQGTIDAVENGIQANQAEMDSIMGRSAAPAAQETGPHGPTVRQGDTVFNWDAAKKKYVPAPKGN